MIWSSPLDCRVIKVSVSITSDAGEWGLAVLLWLECVAICTCERTKRPSENH